MDALLTIVYLSGVAALCFVFAATPVYTALVGLPSFSKAFEGVGEVDQCLPLTPHLHSPPIVPLVPLSPPD
jgi:hypothetical protein